MKHGNYPNNIHCSCSKRVHTPKFIVLTGGPGAGKTAVLEMLRKILCKHVVILPEAASIIFNGGFPRSGSTAAKKGAQRAIYHVQREQEWIMANEKNAAVVLCDRGTLDGIAYWPNSEESYFEEIGTSLQEELLRYCSVIHLETPSLKTGYNHRNPARVEGAAEAAVIDKKISKAWAGHPHRHFIKSSVDFMEKAREALRLIEEEIPECCLGKSLK